MQDIAIKNQESLSNLWALIEKLNIKALEDFPKTPNCEDGFIVWFIRDTTLNEKPKNTKGRLILEMAATFDGLSDKQLKCLLAAHRYSVCLLRAFPGRFFVTSEKCPKMKGAGRDQPGPLNLVCMPGDQILIV